MLRLIDSCLEDDVSVVLPSGPTKQPYAMLETTVERMWERVDVSLLVRALYFLHTYLGDAHFYPFCGIAARLLKSPRSWHLLVRCIKHDVGALEVLNHRDWQVYLNKHSCRRRLVKQVRV